MGRRLPILVALILLALPTPALALRGAAYRGPRWCEEPFPPGTGPYLGPNVPVDDIWSYWYYWFENNKEWVLESRAAARRANAAEPVLPATRKDVVLPVLIAALEDKSEIVRNAAVIALGKLGGPEVVPHVVRALEDESLIVREDALLALGLTREPAAREQLLKSLLMGLGSGDRKTTARAALGLALLGDRSVRPALLDLYTLARKSEHDKLACALATAIGFLGEEADAKGLRPRRGAKPSVLLSVHLCAALGRLGGDYAWRKLDDFFDAKNQEVKAAAALALWRPRGEVERKLLNHGLKSEHISVQALSALALTQIAGRLPESRSWRRKLLTKLSWQAAQPGRNCYIAQFAALGLGIICESLPEKKLREVVRYEKPARDLNRAAIALALGFAGDRLVAPDLQTIVRMDGYDPDLRGYCALALGLMDHRESIPRITDSMRRHRNRRELIRGGCWALGIMGDRSDLPFLLEQLKREGEGMQSVRGAAAAAIGLIADRTAVKPLIEIVRKDPAASNRAYAIAAIGWLCDKDPVPRIPRLFRNVNYRKPFPVQQQVMSIL